jgi:hypothetical protein
VGLGDGVGDISGVGVGDISGVGLGVTWGVGVGVGVAASSRFSLNKVATTIKVKISAVAIKIDKRILRVLISTIISH